MVLVLGPSSFLLSFRFLAFLLLPPVLVFFWVLCALFFPPLLLGSFSGFSSQNPPWFRLLLSSSVPKILLCSGSFFVSSPVVFLLPVFFPLLFSLPMLFVFPLLRFVRCPPVFVCLLLWFSGPWVCSVPSCLRLSPALVFGSLGFPSPPPPPSFFPCYLLPFKRPESLNNHYPTNGIVVHDLLQISCWIGFSVRNGRDEEQSFQRCRLYP